MYLTEHSSQFSAGPKLSNWRVFAVLSYGHTVSIFSECPIAAAAVFPLNLVAMRTLGSSNGGGTNKWPRENYEHREGNEKRGEMRERRARRMRPARATFGLPLPFTESTTTAAAAALDPPWKPQLTSAETVFALTSLCCVPRSVSLSDWLTESLSASNWSSDSNSEFEIFL